MEYKDYYQFMGVRRDAKPDEIKRAYRKLARKYHPDVSKEPDAENKFKELQEAYEVLKDSKKRAAYDQLGQQWQSGQAFKAPPSWEFHGFDTGSFSGVGGEFSDFFETLFGGGSRRYTPHRGFAVRGEDIHSKIDIDLEEAYSGAARTIQLQVPEVDQQGRMTKQSRVLKVKIPAGVIQGQLIRLAGQGGKGFQGLPNGDLYLEINIRTHSLFKVEGRNIYLTLPVAPWEAALGAKVTVPTLAGNVEMVIPPGAQSNQKLRLKGKGLSSKVTGDQFITLQIMIPEPKNEEQRKFYELMAKEMPFDPRG